MTFLISDTFSGSFGRLTGDEQKAVKTTAFDLQMKPASPGLRSSGANITLMNRDTARKLGHETVEVLRAGGYRGPPAPSST